MATLIIRGTDGAVPQYDPNNLWKTWNYDEIYFGNEATNKHVPKVNDYVRSLQQKKTYRVTAIDSLLIPTLVDESDEDDTLVSQVLIGDGLQAVSFRLYLDTTKLPYEASVDSRHEVNGSANTYARIFLGTDVGPSGKVVSAVFAGSTLIDDKIPLELVAYDNHTVLAKKTVPTFNTKENMPDGQVCTLVIYNAQNSITAKKVLKVERTSYNRPINASQKYISSISMESVFLSDVVPYTLNYPINAPITGLNVTGVLHYSDGSESKLPVDGNKFSLFGVERFIATRPGQKVPLVLSYRLDSNESAYGGVSADGKKITEPYTIVTTHEDGSFSPILMGYPRWDATTSMYKLRWWLLDLNRATLFDATSAVQFNASGDVFDGVNFNTMQFLSVRVKLNEVSMALPEWTHTQTMYVRLYDPSATITPVGKWEVSQENVFGMFYGTDLKADVVIVNQNEYTVSIDNNFSTRADWLNKMYYNSKPVFNLYRESQAPEPTHFSIINSLGNAQTFPISAWNTDFSIFTNISTASNLIVRWERHLGNNVLVLAVTELVINFVI